MAGELEGIMVSNELDELAIKYGADKWGKHHYTPVYYNLFASKRNMVRKVVEIGIGEGVSKMKVNPPQKGASLKMWRDFFPNAQIYGVDNDPKCLFTENRIKTFLFDQNKEDDLISLLNITDSDIDLFIDDGSHEPSAQVFTAKDIIPSLDKGTVYIIEDVANSQVFDLLKNRFGYLSCQLLRVGKRFDDRLIIIKK